MLRFINVSASARLGSGAEVQDDGAVFADAFDANRDILATGGAGKLVRLWNTSSTQVAAYICAVAGDRITRSEWNKYLPGVSYHPPC